jgi:ParB-like nuclease domain
LSSHKTRPAARAPRAPGIRIDGPGAAVDAIILNHSQTPQQHDQTRKRLPMTKDKYQLLPELPPEQFAALKADIAERGVVVAVIVDEFGDIIDGHNRARACRELGKNDYPVEVRSGLSADEKRALSRKLNALRRHLTRDQMRQLIADQVKETPAWANNRLAGALGVDDKTVASVRTHLEATSEIPRLDTLTGADGKGRPRKQAKRRHLTIDHDDYDNDEEDIPAKGKPEYTEKELDDLWAGKGKLAQMKQNALRHAIALMEEGVPSDSPAIAALIKDASIVTFEAPGYDPLAGRTDEEKRQWHVFMLYLVRHHNHAPEGAAQHCEWLLGRFQNVEEWMGEEGDKFCKSQHMRQVSSKLKKQWALFATEHASRTLPDLIAELEHTQR